VFAWGGPPGDINGDGRVDTADLLILIQHWQEETTPTPTATPPGTSTPTPSWTVTPTPTFAAGTGSLTGTVRDAGTQARLSGVLVDLVAGAHAYQTLTVDGSYLLLNVPYGQYQFRARKDPEYVPFVLSGLSLTTNPTPINVALTRQPTTPTPTPSPTPTATATASPTSTVPNTFTPTGTPTRTPTSTRTPTVTRTPTPSPALLALGSGRFQTADASPATRNGEPTTRLAFVFDAMGHATDEYGVSAVRRFAGTYLYTGPTDQHGAFSFSGSTEFGTATLEVQQGTGLPVGGPYPNPESLELTFTISDDAGAVYYARVYRQP